MSEIDKKEPQIGRDISDYLTEEERKKLLASLHHALVWVGVKEPEDLQIDRGDLESEMDKFHQTENDLPAEIHAAQGRVELHHLIWRLINEKEITVQERQQIEEMIEILEKKEKTEEEALKVEKLTSKQAIALHDEAAGIIRALLDLKDLLKKREHSIETKDAEEELIRQKVNEAKRWNNLLDQIQKDKG
jgi:hypothetical protein